MDRMVKCVTPDGNIRAVGLVATDLVRELCRRHGLSPRGKQAFGEALMGALLLASNCKRGERMNLKVDGTGYFRQVLVDAYPEGHVRGMMSERPETEAVFESEDGAPMGPWGAGVLSVLRTKATDAEHPYIGSVPLVTGYLAKDLTFYWLQSEQIPSAVGLAVNLKDGEVTSAGAFLIQVLPNASDEEVTLIQRQLQHYPEFASDLAERSDPVFVLSRIFQGRQITKLEEKPVEFHCSCSAERVRRSLMLLGPTELQAIYDDTKGTKLQCDFCMTEYVVTGERLLDMIHELTRRKKSRSKQVPRPKKSVGKSPKKILGKSAKKPATRKARPKTKRRRGAGTK
ncbi:MAG: Hsp33 family molecular chaperone HslO [Bdellovibrionales bacterium]|nr:Hsp33 family molecular chaperone HslO [Bdellovibrionales bacterium]